MSAVAYSGAEGANVQAMLDAVLAISSDLDLHSVLNTIVDSCCEVSGARYGFLGVLGENGELVDHVVHGLSDEQVKQLIDHPLGVGLLGQLGQLDSFLGVPLRVGETVFGNLYLSDKAGSEPFSERDEEMVAALARAAGVAVGNARAYGLSERRREWVEATAQITESLHPPFRIEDTLHQIVVGARRVTRASLAAVVHGREGGYDVPAADGPGYAGLADLLESCAGDAARAQAGGELVVSAYGEESTVVCVPLEADLSYPGVLVVLIDRGRGNLPRDDGRLLTSYTAQASLALDRAQSLEERQQMLLVADRDRIARDLHDLVIQRLFATGLQLQGARRITNLRNLHTRLDTAVADLDQTIRDIRSTIFELEHGRDDTLRSQIATLVREYEPTLGVAATVRTTGAIDSLVDRELGEHLLATLREALSNVARHAQAATCIVEVHVDPDQLLLVVRDDGRGVGDDVVESGLRNLRRRAAECGGTLCLRAAHPRGTRLEWRVPTGA